MQQSVVSFWRRGIAARSWLVAGLTLAAVAALAIPALRLSEITFQASQHVSTTVATGITTAADLEVKLEQHRRLVESAPAEVEREQLDRHQAAAAELEGQLASLMQKGAPDLYATLLPLLPMLIDHRQRVFMFASNYAQDQASLAASQYAAIAQHIAEFIAGHRLQQTLRTQSWARELTESAASINTWFWVCIVATMIVLGPVGMTITHSTVSRLGRLRGVMMRLAANDTDVTIPSLGSPDEVGDIARAVLVFRANAIALLENEAKLRQTNQHFDIAINNMSQGLCMFDADQRLVVCNHRYRALFDLTEEEARPGTTFRQLLEHRIRRGQFNQETPEDFLKARIKPVTQSSVEVLRNSDGRWICVTRVPMAGGGWVATHEDVTAQQTASRRIAHMASHDALTNLANRIELKAVLDRELDRVRAGSAFALHYLDLDRFKAVNDVLGHPVGDALLKAVAARLSKSVRATDTVARLGGDEFAVVQIDAGSPQSASDLARRLVGAISKPYRIGEHTIEIGTSIGTSMAPQDALDADELIKNADLALYRAKASGKGRACLYTPDIQESFLARRSLELDLKQALASDQLALVFQPVIELRSDKVIGCEALIRWHHPERGTVSPVDFIPVAEEAGLIGEIGAWVIRTACRIAAGWPEDIKVSVNLSPAQFKDGDVAALVTDALAQSGLAATRLTIEITESTLLQENDGVLGVLNQLRSLGVIVLLDDFGTGYSSLSYLRRFPFDGLKIDKSFIRDAAGRSNCVAIVQAIVNMARSLGMGTVAEGVETADDLEMVRAAGCSHAQGYLISRPVPPDALPPILARLARDLQTAA